MHEFRTKNWSNFIYSPPEVISWANRHTQKPDSILSGFHQQMNVIVLSFGNQLISRCQFLKMRFFSQNFHKSIQLSQQKHLVICRMKNWNLFSRKPKNGCDSIVSFFIYLHYCLSIPRERFIYSFRVRYSTDRNMKITVLTVTGSMLIWVCLPTIYLHTLGDVKLWFMLNISQVLPSKYFISLLRTLESLLVLLLWHWFCWCWWYYFCFCCCCSPYRLKIFSSGTEHLFGFASPIQTHSFYIVYTPEKPSKTSVLIMFRKHACQTLYQPASCWWFTTRSLWRHSIFTVQIIKIPNTLLFDFCMVESNSLLPLLEWEMLEQRQWDALISKYAFGFMFATPYSYSYPMHKLRLMVSHLHVLNDFGAGVCHAEKLSSVFGTHISSVGLSVFFVKTGR